MSTRRAACRLATRSAAIPGYLSGMRPVRGRCTATLGRSRRVCGSRWGIVRVSLDFTSRERVDRLATVECVACGHTWRRVRPPQRLTTPDGYQSVRLSLILPSEQRRWFARGRWHVSGTDAVTVGEATVADLMAAQDDWRKRADQHLAAAARARAKREAEAAAAHQRAAEWLARLAERDAERAAAEAEAAAREAA